MLILASLPPPLKKSIIQRTQTYPCRIPIHYGARTFWSRYREAEAWSGKGSYDPMSDYTLLPKCICPGRGLIWYKCKGGIKVELCLACALWSAQCGCSLLCCLQTDINTEPPPDTQRVRVKKWLAKKKMFQQPSRSLKRMYLWISYNAIGPARQYEQTELQDIDKGADIKYECNKYYIFHNYRRQRWVLSVSYFLWTLPVCLILRKKQKTSAGHKAAEHWKFIKVLLSEACISLRPPHNDNLISSTHSAGSCCYTSNH